MPTSPRQSKCKAATLRKLETKAAAIAAKREIAKTQLRALRAEAAADDALCCLITLREALMHAPLVYAREQSDHIACQIDRTLQHSAIQAYRHTSL
jgi:hypothetical protein